MDTPIDITQPQPEPAISDPQMDVNQHYEQEHERQYGISSDEPIQLAQNESPDVILGAKQFDDRNGTIQARSDTEPGPSPRIAVAQPIGTYTEKSRKDADSEYSNTMQDRGQPRDLENWSNQSDAALDESPETSMKARLADRATWTKQGRKYTQFQNSILLPVSAKGLLVPGNIDLRNRPVVRNADGSRSTEYSTSFGDEKGREVLVPTIVDGKFLTPDGRKPASGSPEEREMFKRAQQHYEATGEHMGIFSSPAAADAYAEKIHNRPQAIIATPDGSKIAFPKGTTATEANERVSSWWQDRLDKATNVIGGIVQNTPGLAPALEAGQKYYVDPIDKYIGKVGEAAEASTKTGFTPKTEEYLRKQGVNPSPMPEWMKGVNDATIKFAAQTVADPRMWPFFAENLASKATTSVARTVLGRALSSAVATQMGASAVKSLRDLSTNWESMSPRERSEVLTGGTLNALMSGLSGFHAAVGSPVAKPTTEEPAGYTGPERRTNDRALMSPTDINAAIEKRQFHNIKTPFDATTGAMDTINRDSALPKVPGTEAPAPVAINASGESAASQEAINRVASQRTQGVKTYRVDSRSGNAVPVLGVDAVDATAKPFEHIVQVRPDGSVDIQDSGRGARPLDEQRLLRQVAPQQTSPLAQKAAAELGGNATPEEINARTREMANGVPAPKTAKAAAGRSVGAASIDDLETKPDVPTFFSKAEQVINDKVQNNASAEQVRALLTNGGVKEDEMKWTGLDDFLKEHSGKISKPELQQFIKENQIQLKEVEKGVPKRFTTQPNEEESAHQGEPMVDVIDPKNGLVRFTGTPDAAQGYMSELGQGLSHEEEEELESLHAVTHAIDQAQIRVRNAANNFGIDSPQWRQEQQALDDEMHQYTGGVRGDYERVNMRNNSRIQELETKAKSGAVESATQYGNSAGLGGGNGDWTVPGPKSNYQERLLTLPTPETPEQKAFTGYMNNLLTKYGEQPDTYDNRAVIDRVRPKMTSEEQQEGRRLGALARESSNAEGNFNAQHFSGNPNIIAHIRYSDRQAVDGAKTLFLEEAQSDWHSAGRHEGYKAPAKEIAQASKNLQDVTNAKTALLQQVADRVNAEREARGYATPADVQELKELTEARYRDARDNAEFAVRTEQDARDARIADLREKNEFNLSGKLSAKSSLYQLETKFTPEEQAQFSTLQSKLSHAIEEKRKVQGEPDAVPDAPFKQNWQELAMKRMLRHAAENGYDRLAWTTGDQQVDLYDLSKHIGRVEYDPEEKEIHAFDPQGKKVIDESAEPTVKALTPYVGEVLAKKLVDRIDDYQPESAPDPDWFYDSARENYDIDEREEPDENHEFEITPEREQFDEHMAELAKKYRDKLTGLNGRTPLWNDLKPFLTPEELADGQDLLKSAKDAEAEQEEDRPTNTMYYVTDQGGSEWGPFESSHEAEQEMSDRIDKDVQYEMENYESEKPELPALEGLDLHHGGKFHKLLYDTMIPSFLKKYAKKWGATVGTTEMKNMGEANISYEGPDKTIAELEAIKANGGVDGQAVLDYEQMNRLKDVLKEMRIGKSFQQAMAFIKNKSKSDSFANQIEGAYVRAPINSTVHSIDITPAMRKSVMKEGQPIAKKDEKKRPGISPQEMPQVASKSDFQKRLSAKLINQLA